MSVYKLSVNIHYEDQVRNDSPVWLTRAMKKENRVEMLLYFSNETVDLAYVVDAAHWDFGLEQFEMRNRHFMNNFYQKWGNLWTMRLSARILVTSGLSY